MSKSSWIVATVAQLAANALIPSCTSSMRYLSHHQKVFYVLGRGDTYAQAAKVAAVAKTNITAAALLVAEAPDESFLDGAGVEGAGVEGAGLWSEAGVGAGAGASVGDGFGVEDGNTPDKHSSVKYTGLSRLSKIMTPPRASPVQDLRHPVSRMAFSERQDEGSWVQVSAQVPPGKLLIALNATSTAPGVTHSTLFISPISTIHDPLSSPSDSIVADNCPLRSHDLAHPENNDLADSHEVGMSDSLQSFTHVGHSPSSSSSSPSASPPSSSVHPRATKPPMPV
mmetsp:Transcript_12535/g.15093  ORF Transcript_12535/g.15093 Transcript_12535/m.15093 type:complete len:283 (+) Transcript_12535:944-1792(+)